MKNDPVVITRYPASRGGVWMREAYRMLSLARLRWLSLLALYYFVLVAAVGAIPYLGPLALPVLKPVFMVGLLAAAWAQERGEAPRLMHLFQGFRANLWALLPLGFVLLGSAMLAVLASAAIDGGQLLDLLTGTTQLAEDTAVSPDIQAAMLFAAGCVAPVLLAMWYAPALVVFHDCSPWHALALSIRATLVNWRAFLVYGGLFLIYGVVIPRLAMTLIAVALPPGLIRPAVVLLVLPYFFLFIATLHIADYVSYRDIFHADEKPPPDANPPSPT